MNISKASPFRLATFNVRNYFDGFDDPMTRDEKTAKDPVSAAAVADVIRESHADLVALQEIETIEELTVLRDRHGLTEVYPYLVLLEGNDTRGTDVALMSRYPVSGVKSHKDEVIGVDKGKDTKFRRDLLQADVALPNEQTLRVFVTHYVKQGNSWNDDRRLEEAEATRNIVLKESREFPVAHTVVMGDCNDFVGSATLNTLTSPADDATLYNISDGTPNSWGHWEWQAKKYGGPSRLDHIFTTGEFYQRLVGHGVMEGASALKASDHNLVFADFLLPVAA